MPDPWRPVRPVTSQAPPEPRVKIQRAEPREGGAPAAESPWTGDERRTQGDRRTRPTVAWAAWAGHRRRQRGRRAGEQTGAYVDVYAPQDVAMLAGIFLLNVLDAAFTLSHLSRGGREANPVMARLLELGPDAFLFTKCFVVGGWLLFLLVHKNFRLVKVGLWATLALYAGVFGWHLFLHFGAEVLPQPPPNLLAAP